LYFRSFLSNTSFAYWENNLPIGEKNNLRLTNGRCSTPFLALPLWNTFLQKSLKQKLQRSLDRPSCYGVVIEMKQSGLTPIHFMDRLQSIYNAQRNKMTIETLWYIVNWRWISINYSFATYLVPNPGKEGIPWERGWLGAIFRRTVCMCKFAWYIEVFSFPANLECTFLTAWKARMAKHNGIRIKVY
jgi:hypothetical protein